MGAERGSSSPPHIPHIPRPVSSSPLPTGTTSAWEDGTMSGKINIRKLIAFLRAIGWDDTPLAEVNDHLSRISQTGK